MNFLHGYIAESAIGFPRLETGRSKPLIVRIKNPPLCLEAELHNFPA